VRTEGRQREAVGENHHQRCKHLRSPEAGTPVSSSTFASSFQIELLQEQCSCTLEFTSRVLLVFFCPAGSLAWASDRAGLAGSSPAHVG
jgi:hypothetical protein